MPPAIHQLVAGYRQGDAISNEARALRKIFRAWGHPSEIVCEAQRAAPQVRAEIRTPSDILPALRPGDVALLHLSIGTAINRFFATLPCRKVILYHNVTPAEYFRLYNPALHDDLAAGRRDAAALAGVAELNLADSRFNARELEAMGYRDTKVLPLVFNLDEFPSNARDPATLRRLGEGHANILFVGRCVPNKRLEDILVAVHYLQKNLGASARFVHVGSYAGVEAYYTLLLAQNRELGLRDTLFLGPVTQDALNTCYASAGLFLCLSEHEGFCAPLLEAMLHGVPVLARDAGAVAETLDGVGVLFHDPDPRLVAETAFEVLADPVLRASIVGRQNRRIDAFRRRDVDAELRALFAPLGL
ncbi:MAG: glycosyltransferase family 4 protein [Kiritimatiellia bacterium]|jgi:glycosyltransferase involved in cell wall biosynthesis